MVKSRRQEENDKEAKHKGTWLTRPHPYPYKQSDYFVKQASTQKCM